jgi:hypothetical protein
MSENNQNLLNALPHPLLPILNRNCNNLQGSVPAFILPPQTSYTQSAIIPQLLATPILSRAAIIPHPLPLQEIPMPAIIPELLHHARKTYELTANSWRNPGYP